MACTSKKENAQNDIVHISFQEEGNPILSEKDMECYFIPLETTLDNLMGEIHRIEIFDNLIFALDNTQRKLLIFDMNGKFVQQIGNNGNGPGGYVYPMNFSINKNKRIISIADAGQNKLLNYNLDNYQYMSTQKTSNFRDCILLSDENIAWYSTSGLDLDKRMRYFLRITDSDLQDKEYHNEADFTSHYGISSGSAFHQLKDRSFIHFSHSASIWEITTAGTKAVYQLSFGADQLPPLEYLQEESRGQRDYAKSLLNSEYIYTYEVHETASHVAILYYKKGETHIGFYNKETKQAQKYFFPDFMRATSLIGLGRICGVYGDYFVARMHTDMAKKNAIKREDLHMIYESVSEDDNPILCLFKIK